MSSDAPQFQPLIQLMEFPDPEQRQAAENIYKELQENDFKSFHDEVETKVQAEIQKIPKKTREAFSNEIRHTFLIKNYMNLAQNYLTQKNADKNFNFNPVVQLNEISDQSKRQRTALAYSKVCAEHVSIIKQNVERSYELEKPTADWMSEKIKECMWKDWILRRYPEIVEAVVAHKTKTPNSTQENKENTTADVTEISNPAQMFYSLKKKRRTNAANNTEDDIESCFRSVADLHMGAMASTISLQCYLLHCPEMPRIVTISRPAKKEETSVLTMLGADYTGPIKIDLWGKIADDQALSIYEMQEATNEQQLILLELNHFRLADVREAHQTPMRKLHSTPKSTIRQLTTPTQPFLNKETATMSSNLFSRQLSCLIASPPFDVSVAGIITDLEQPMKTENSELIRKYTLVDRSGKYISCVALGRHAENEILQDNNEIAIYFGRAQEGRGNNPGSLWLYDECHVVLLRANRESPQKKEKIEFSPKKA